MTVKDFLDRHLINPDLVDMEKLCNYILEQMNSSLNGKGGSLPMIDSFCKPSFSVKNEETVAVIDAGGTNLRTCLVKFSANGQAEISDFKKSSMPGIEKEVSAKEFFSIIADEVERLVDKTDRIGFCFSYAAKILPNHDGIPLMFSKEIKAPEVLGKKIGEELFRELKARGHNTESKKIIIMNDTVATLLAGLSKTEETGCEGCIGFILGTGTNCAYIKTDCRNDEHTDSTCSDEVGTIINEESGNIDVSLGDIDREFLESTENPNIFKFEKMISGAYMGKAALFVLNQAKKEGLFSENFVLPDTLSTRELGDFLNSSLFEGRISDTTETADTNPVFADVSEKDKAVLNGILVSFVQRSAKLTATSLAASVLITDYGQKKPVLINADGTTFYKTPYLKECTEEYLNSYLASKERSVKFTQIENSPVLGAAVGALSL